MADRPADVDPGEWSPETALTTLDPLPDLTADAEAVPEPIPQAVVPLEVFEETPTDRHKLARSAEFQAGMELGRAQGRAQGYAEGRADVRSEDVEVGREEILDVFRRALITDGTDPAVALMMKDRLREWARLNPSKR